MVSVKSAENALKSYYLDAVTDMLNTSANPFLAQIKQTTADVWGKDIKKVVRYGVNGGVGAGTETGALPVANGNNYAVLTASLKNLYGTISISDKAIKASQNNEGAFVNLLNEEMDGLMRSASFNLGRMLFGDGTGKLATVNGITSGTISLDSVKNLAEGMTVDFISEVGAVLAAAKVIRAVDRVNKTITLVSTTLTYTIVPNGSSIYLQGSIDNEISGLGAIFSSNVALYGLNKNTNAWLKPYTQSGVGEITENKIQKVIDYLDEVAGSQVNFIICSWGVKRALAEYLSTYKRIVDTVELNGGYKALTFNGIPVVADRFCPDGTMYLLNTDDFVLHQLGDWQWLEGEGGSVLKQEPNKAAYSATLVKYAELMCYRPCGQAMLTGITEA